MRCKERSFCYPQYAYTDVIHRNTIQLGIAMLRKSPKFRIALARSLLFLAVVGDTSTELESRAAQKEGLAIYYEHVGNNENTKSLEAIIEHLDELILD